MWTYEYVHKHIYIDKYILIYIYNATHTRTQIPLRRVLNSISKSEFHLSERFIYTYTYTHIYTYIYIDIHIYIHTLTFIHIFLHTYIYIHTHTHAPRFHYGEFESQIEKEFSIWANLRKIHRPWKCPSEHALSEKPPDAKNCT